MSEPTDTEAIDTLRQEIAAATGGKADNDPLVEYIPKFEDLDEYKPFQAFIAEILEPDDLAPRTRGSYERTFRYWIEFMEEEGRHPALPGEGHARRFIRVLRDDYDHQPSTIRKQIQHLDRVWEYWQRESMFPHSTDFNPFAIALEKESLGSSSIKKELPRIDESELREQLQDLLHIRDRAIVISQLKLGLRAGEIQNIQLQDIALEHADLNDHYPDLGTHDKLRDRDNVIYIPSCHERKGNKSKRPRLLPLDDEMRQVLIRYLLIRPDTGSPWVFLSKAGHRQLSDEKPINRAWSDAFPEDEYGETDEYRAVTSHFGRHRFTTYWMIDQELSRELVKYMRGDKTGKNREAIDDYVHAYYEDIENRYLEYIYKLL
ncbi:tyrosine-type recombinase/integrase [Natrinema sp. SYSU A 869]|uniref:tyrosine-type recombinase/integrase n=1 Tax=Natrinema sp. SYSU A 869 TaxID=2871694 RepID=UPI001CA40FFE|nr:tyrosine-type recombinase/integrase [Natrinema sp. SYSU A 869]